MKRILIVDDSETLSEMLKSMFLENGYLADTAGTAEEAYKKIRERRPDLIILDLVLPDMNGIDFCSHLKKNKETQFVPIIMCTASAISPQDKVKGLDTGADDYVTKPFAMEEMMSRVSALLRRIDATSKAIKEQGIKKEMQSILTSESEKKQELVKIPFLKCLGCSLVAPKMILAYMIEMNKGIPWSWLSTVIVFTSLFDALPNLLSEGTKSFVMVFSKAALGLLVILSFSATCVWIFCFVLFRKKIDKGLIFTIISVSFTPIILLKVLACIYVFLAGHPAAMSHFSAGMGLVLPAIKTKVQMILSQSIDLFTLWSCALASIGVSISIKTTLTKLLPITFVSLSLALYISGLLPFAH